MVTATVKNLWKRVESFGSLFNNGYLHSELATTNE